MTETSITYVLKTHRGSEALPAVLAVVLETTRGVWQARADFHLDVMVEGGLGREPTEADTTMQVGCRLRRSSNWRGGGGDGWKDRSRCRHRRRLWLLFTFLVLGDIAGLVSKTFGSCQRIDKALGIDGPEPLFKSLVEERNAGLGQDERR